MIDITYVEPLEAIRAAIEATTGARAFVGVLPPNEGISLVMTGGAVQHDLAGNVAVRMQFAVNAKGKGQESAAALLGAAQSAINRLTPAGTNWQCTGVSMNGGPVQVGSDPQGYFLMGSTATARLIYWQHDPPAPTPPAQTEEEDEDNDADNG